MSELMDQPDSDLNLLDRTLTQFDFVNRHLSRARYVLQKFVVAQMRREPDREYHLLDLGAGACETAAWLLNHCRKRGIKLRVSACDHDPRVVNFARLHYGDTPGLRINERGLADLGDLAPFDFVFGNHLLHHLSDAEISALLKQLDQFPQATVLFNDLHRGRLAYTAFYILSPFIFHNSFARYDGLLSIRKGFKTAELLSLAAQATTERREGYRTGRLFPNRVILWRPSMENKVL